MNPWRALGPIGLLLQSIHEIGEVFDTKFNLHRYGEPAVRILDGPFNHMKPMLGDLFARARTAEAQGKRKLNVHISEIDAVATRGNPKLHDEEDSSRLRILQSGGAWGKEALHAIDRAEDMQCDLCGAAKQSPEHTSFYCNHPEVVKARQNADFEISNLNPDLLPAHIKLGIATVMSPYDFTTYWGDHWDTIDASIAHLMGVRGAMQHESRAQQMIDEHLLVFGDPRIDPTCSKPNARILMQNLKAPDIEHTFNLPGMVHGKPPDKFNC